MHRWLVVILLLWGCNGSSANTTVKLSNSERTQAVSIAERRQAISFERQAAQAEFQTKINHFSERENALNLESNKLCFEFKKSHALPPNSNWQLDEWNGVLIKQ